VSYDKNDRRDIGRYLLRSSLSRLDFLRWGCTEQFLNWSGKMPVEKDRLIMLMIMLVLMGNRIWEHCFTRDIGIGSKSQLVSGGRGVVETSSVVTQVKDERLGGVNGGGMWEGWKVRWSK